MAKINLSASDYSLKDKNNLWLELIGTPKTFALESRIFHSICIGLIALLSIYVPYNLYAGLYVGSLSALFFGVFFLFQYYNSRFRGKKHNSTLFGIAGILIFGINYFTNSGINGSTDLIWPVHLLLVFAISPYRHHAVWLIVYMICFFLLHLVEHKYPDLVSHPFTAGDGQFIDRVTAFPIPVIAIYIIIRFIRRSHDKERQTAEEKKMAVQTLMSIISHDLRTPLMNIQNYLQLLNQIELERSERATLEKALLKSTNSTVDMLSNLLHWSKSQMDGTAVQLAEINLFSTLLGTLEMEKVHAWEKKIALDYNIPTEINVVADVDMLQLVIRNLISNSIKFTAPGGSIHIDAQLVDGACKITVKDNGKGIPADKQEKVFTIKSAPAFGTNNEKGVGLGLHLCREFTEKQGGWIDFESSPDVGSSFFVYLPIKR